MRDASGKIETMAREMLAELERLRTSAVKRIPLREAVKRLSDANRLMEIYYGSGDMRIIVTEDRGKDSAFIGFTVDAGYMVAEVDVEDAIAKIPAAE
jgi:hypothetical protein